MPDYYIVLVLNESQSRLLNQSISFYQKFVFNFEFESLIDEFLKYPHSAHLGKDLDFDSVVRSARLMMRALSEIVPQSSVDAQRIFPLSACSPGVQALSCQDARMIFDSLEFYERVIGLGQAEEIFSRINLHFSRRIGFKELEIIRSFSITLKSLLWGHSSSSSFGIHSSSISNDFRIIYDIIQVVRHTFYNIDVMKANESGDKDNLNNLRYSLWADLPRSTSGMDLPIAMIKTTV